MKWMGKTFISNVKLLSQDKSGRTTYGCSCAYMLAWIMGGRKPICERVGEGGAKDSSKGLKVAL
jgi:hypothetical protein